VNPVVTTLILLAPILAAYEIVVLVRRRRLRNAAEALEATYVSEGWWRAGRIVGRNFEIRVVKIGKTFRTYVEVQAPGIPLSSMFDARFFDAYPNWGHAKVLARGHQRLFFVEISLPGYVTPTLEQRDALWRWLNRGSTDHRLPYETLRSARIRRIVVEDARFLIDFSGVVSNVRRLGTTLDLLQQFAAQSGRT
jgi:hypothetical protein